MKQYLRRYGEPPRDDVASAVERVWHRLAPDVLRNSEPGTWKAEPARRPAWRVSVAAAAAVVVLAASIGTAILWPRGAQLYSTGDAGTLFTLADDSRVEMRAHSELTVTRADDGIRIYLTKGGIIVNAAKQRDGHLYVETKDMTVAVVGTVFVVNATDAGSRVGVIEGEVRVREGARETTLRPGEHVATNPAVASRPLTEDVSWSREKDAYQKILGAFEQGMAQTSGPLVRVAEPPALQQSAGARTAEQAGRPEFEEASVRQCDPDNMPPTLQGARGGGPNSLYMTPGRLHALCLTLATLVRTAYDFGPMDLEVLNTTENAVRPNRPGMRFEAVYGLGVEDGRRVRGGPDWVRNEHYTIEAVAPGQLDANMMRGPMLRALLERRFQLRVRVDAEQVPAFALTLAPGGLKVKPMEPGDCRTEPIPEAVRAERERKGWRGPVLITEAAYFGIKPNCGFIYGERNGPNLRVEAANSPGRVPIGGDLGARVVDRTGITDNYLYTFEYGPDETTPGAMRWMSSERDWIPKPGFDAPATHPKAAPLARALEEQLGLKLEPIRLPREFIVIDRVERPGPN